METINDLVQKALEGIELLKHPGHPNQKIHGRRGGKGGSKKPSGSDSSAPSGNKLESGGGWSSEGAKEFGPTAVRKTNGTKKVTIWQADRPMSVNGKMVDKPWGNLRQDSSKKHDWSSTGWHETREAAVSDGDKWLAGR